MSTPTFDFDPAAFKDSANKTRELLLSIQPFIKRVDEYAHTTLAEEWAALRSPKSSNNEPSRTSSTDEGAKTFDGIIQRTEETMVDLSVVLKQNYLVVDDAIKDPSAVDDIITEFETGRKRLEENNEPRLLEISDLDALKDTIAQFTVKYDTVVKSSSKAIDDELNASTAEVAKLTTEVDSLKKKLEELSSGTIGTIQKGLGDLIGSLKKPGETGQDKKPNQDDPNKEERSNLEHELAAAKQRLSDAEHRKAAAITLAGERDKAETPSTLSKLNSAHTAIISLVSQVEKFGRTYTSMIKEFSDFIAFLEKSTIDNSLETQRALSNQIQKYTSTLQKAKDYARALSPDNI